MRVAITIIAAYIVAHVVFFGVGKYAEYVGVSRTPERSLSYTAQDLIALAAEQRRYVVPILFPLDLVLMVLLAGALGWAAAIWGPMVLPNWPCWAFLILPMAYLAFDFAEDSFLALLLKFYISITPASVVALKSLTAFKLAAIVLAELQAVAAGLGAVWRYWQA